MATMPEIKIDIGMGAVVKQLECIHESVQDAISKNTTYGPVYLHANCPACGQCHTLIQILNSALVRCSTCEYEGPMIREPEGQCKS